MTRGTVARAERRGKQAEPLPPALRAEQRARVQEAATRREKILAEAKRQRRIVEDDAAATYERVRVAAQEAYKTERAAIEDEIAERARQA